MISDKNIDPMYQESSPKYDNQSKCVWWIPPTNDLILTLIYDRRTCDGCGVLDNLKTFPDGSLNTILILMSNVWNICKYSDW